MTYQETGNVPTWQLGQAPTIVIQPTRGWAALQLHALWEYAISSRVLTVAL